MENKQLIDEKEIINFIKNEKYDITTQKYITAIVRLINNAYKKGFAEGRKNGVVND